MPITRRGLLRGSAGAAVLGVSVAGYAAAEPFRLAETGYRLTPAGWTQGLQLRIVALADLHACETFMDVARIEAIVARSNALAPDLVVLLGDFIIGTQMSRFGKPIPNAQWVRALSGLRAPLGVHAILGNHDWWEDDEAQRRRRGPTAVRVAMERGGIPVYENDARRIVKGGKPFWIAGLGDQWAFVNRRREDRQRAGFRYSGVDDLPGTLAKVTDDAPVVMMIHEPDAFSRMPDRVALTLAGHTHGGQVTFAGYAPIVPSRFGRRYAYGHVSENGRNLVVSAGLGLSGLPLRLGRPPEIVVVELG